MFTRSRPEEIEQPLASSLKKTSDWRRIFGAFKHYNFRVYFVGLFISVLGLWAQNIAQNWLVYELSNSALVLGQVTFILAIPVLLVGPWAGVVIDRVSRRTVLLITQFILMVQAFTLAALDFSNLIVIWHIMALSALRGLANAFDAPARQTIIADLVDKEDLSNGIALNSTMFSLARTIGPALGGIIVAGLGTAWAFSINGITFLAILVSLLLLRLEPVPKHEDGQTPTSELIEGLRFIRSNKAIIALLIIALAVALFGAHFAVLMPIMTVDVLQREEIAYGFLNGASGLGSIGGALAIAFISSSKRRGRRLNLMNLVFPLTLVAFAASRNFVLSVILLIFVGASFIPQLSLVNMLIQTHIPDEIRGRVMSVYSLMIFGAFPVGGLLAGIIAEQVGAPNAIAISAGIFLVIGLLVRVFIPELNELD